MKPDQQYIDIVRASVKQHINAAAAKWDREGIRVLDIAPNEHGGAKEFFSKAKVFTLDINDKFKPDYVLDICDEWEHNNTLHWYKQAERSFDCIICTEVLEHVNDPWRAALTIHHLLSEHGQAYITTPFNLRIHNPLPDLWRFTEHGLRELFRFFKVEIEAVETEGRELMPVCYRTIICHSNEDFF